jgi:hypothetical protein
MLILVYMVWLVVYVLLLAGTSINRALQKDLLTCTNSFIINNTNNSVNLSNLMLTTALDGEDYNSFPYQETPHSIKNSLTLSRILLLCQTRFNNAQQGGLEELLFLWIDLTNTPC